MSSHTAEEPAAGSSCYNTGYPPALRAAEFAAINQRRQIAGLPQLEGEAAALAADGMVGVAFSGGGIRSATFCLGVLQGLAKQGLIGKIDFLSTVSGGGYVGGFFGAMFHRSWAGKKPVDAVEAALADSYSPPLRWLRENGRYLSPNGAGDALLDVASYLRSWIGLQFLLSVFILMLFLGANLLRQLLWQIVPPWRHWEDDLARGAGASLWWSPYILLPAVVLGVAVAPLIWAFWLTQRETMDVGSRMPLYVTVGLVTTAALTIIANQFQPVGLEVLCAFIIAGGLLALAYWGWSNAKAHDQPGAPPTAEERVRLSRNRLSTWLATTLSAFGVLLLFTVTDSLGQTLYALTPFLTIHPLGTLTGLTGLGALISGAQKLVMFLNSRAPKKGERRSLSFGLLSTLIALVLTFALLTTWSAAAHAIHWWGKTPTFDPGTSLLTHGKVAPQRVDLDAQNRITVQEPRPLPVAGEGSKTRPALPVTIGFTLAFLVSAMLGRTLRFLNLSSQQGLYSSRISRAYLGASNETRWSGKAGRISDVIAGDEIACASPAIAMPYRPDQHGGPLHFINVTLNETVDGKSQVEQRDRKGLPMVAGPCGLSVGLRAHALWQDGGEDARYTKIKPIISNPDAFHPLSSNGDEPRCVERLDLGTWIGVSGAAFSTGLGAKTQLGTALLAGYTNVRLGYWWDSLIDPADRKKRVPPHFSERLLEAAGSLFPAQLHLLDEFMARFHGAARRRWYLSDGGHFENTAAYELLRRRVPFILLCDCGQDADYTFEDMANLVRKARLDFKAEIRFLTGSELDVLLPKSLRPLIGTLQQLHRSPKAPSPGPDNQEGRYPGVPYSICHATLAWVHYEDSTEPGSLILFLKPSLTGDEPLDVLQYQSSRPAFPQEPTADQFFDEAQWESYRRLGEHITSSVFTHLPTPGKWLPFEMTRPRPIPPLV